VFIAKEKMNAPSLYNPGSEQEVHNTESVVDGLFIEDVIGNSPSSGVIVK
jgi:hypothetical protein